MKKLLPFLFLTLLCIIHIQANAQNYTRNAGVRGGITAGFTYRNYMDESNALEGILSFRLNGLQVTGLREFFMPKLEEYSENIYMVWGYGAHAGTTYADSWNFGTRTYFSSRKFSPVIGIDGFAGLEYRIREFPLVVGIDYKPFFELSANRFFNLQIWDLAFSLKYAF